MKKLESKNPRDYHDFLNETILEIRKARIKAIHAVNKEAISLYWWMGEHITKNQSHYNWGKSFIDQLSKDLRKTFPESKFGFSPRNLWDMKRFYLEYNDSLELRQLVAEIPWGQNLLIMRKIKKHQERLYYLEATKNFGWTRDFLKAQIDSNAYKRHIKTQKNHNFSSTLPEQLANQAGQSMKDVYMFDMLGVTEPVIESEIERRMVEKIKDVILELGYGFSFIGNQYRIITPDGVVAQIMKRG